MKRRDAGLWVGSYRLGGVGFGWEGHGFPLAGEEHEVVGEYPQGQLGA